MKRSRGKKPEYQLRIARERIGILFEEAEKAAREDKALARRYVELARKIGMRYNVRIPPRLKRKCCRNCHSLLLSSLQRLKNGMIRIECSSCGKITRYPYKTRRINSFH